MRQPQRSDPPTKFRRVIAGLALALLAGLFTTTVAAPSASAADFMCTIRIQGNDAALTFAGSDVGTTANLRNSQRWVATVTGRTSYVVADGAGESYKVVLNSLRRTVACTAPAPPPTPTPAPTPTPVPQPNGYSCVSTSVDGDAVVSFAGKRASSENLRRNGGWAATVTGRAQVRIAGGAGDDYSVRLRGNGYTGPRGFAVVDCTTGNGEPPCETSSILVVCDGALLGSSGDFRTAAGQPINKIDDFLASEATIGRQYDIFHDFLGTSEWRKIADNGFPYSQGMQSLVDDGRVMLINWKNPGGPSEWSAIANGSQDAVIDQTAAAFAEFDEPVFLAFFHEPEDNIAAAGNEQRQFQLARDFAAVYRRIHDRFEAAGADNVIFVWDIMGFKRWYPYYEGGLYPGDDVVDWVAFNQYNWYGCHDGGSWRSPDEVFGTFYDWLEEGGANRPALDKPIMVGEFSTEENRGAPNSNQTKADWYRELGDVIPDLPRIKAMVMFDTEGRRPDGSVQFCEWSISSSPQALAGWRDVTSLPYFNRWHN